MNELSLFTGAGGGLLGTHLLGWKAIGYVEWNEYCQRVVRARIDDGILPIAPIFTDVREFVQSGAAREYRGFADVVTAGFPCQPFSVAGKQLGANDERNMWPATIDVIRAVQPAAVFLENVPPLISGGYIVTVVTDLQAAGYQVLPPLRLSASDVGANHERERVWIVAHTQQNRRQRILCSDEKRGGKTNYHPKEKAQNSLDAVFDTLSRLEKGLGEPSIFRENDGVAHRVDRLAAIGNGQVPAVAAAAWRLLTDSFHTTGNL